MKKNGRAGHRSFNVAASILFEGPVKGGLMYEAAIGGQKFNYKDVKSPD